MANSGRTFHTLILGGVLILALEAGSAEEPSPFDPRSGEAATWPLSLASEHACEFPPLVIPFPRRLQASAQPSTEPLCPAPPCPNLAPPHPAEL